MAACSSRLVAVVTWNAVECIEAEVLDAKIARMGHYQVLPYLSFAALAVHPIFCFLKKESMDF